MEKSVFSIFCIITLLALTLSGCAGDCDEAASPPEPERIQEYGTTDYEYETQELYARREGNQIYGQIWKR